MRGGTLRGGQRRDLFSCSLSRSGLAAGERRTVLISRATVLDERGGRPLGMSAGTRSAMSAPPRGTSASP